LAFRHCFSDLFLPVLLFGSSVVWTFPSHFPSSEVCLAFTHSLCPTLLFSIPGFAPKFPFVFFCSFGALLVIRLPKLMETYNSTLPALPHRLSPPVWHRACLPALHPLPPPVFPPAPWNCFFSPPPPTQVTASYSTFCKKSFLRISSFFPRFRLDRCPWIFFSPPVRTVPQTKEACFVRVVYDPSSDIWGGPGPPMVCPRL